MAHPPSRFSPEFFKPQKPENHSCCGGACGPPPEVKVIKKRGCYVRYNVTSGAQYNAGSGPTQHKSC